MKIEKNKIVSIHYTLKNIEGEIIDSSSGSEPLEYMHGCGMLISGLEKELEGKAAGEKLSVAIEPKDGYGEYDKTLVVDVPKAHFPSDIDIEIGMQFQTEDGTLVTVKEVKADTITVDANHELAGVKLFFDVTIVNVREATEAELNAGHQGGGCGGCGGDCSCGGDCGDSTDSGCGCGGGCGCGN